MADLHKELCEVEYLLQGVLSYKGERLTSSSMNASDDMSAADINTAVACVMTTTKRLNNTFWNQ